MLRTFTTAGRTRATCRGELQFRSQVNLLVKADGHRRPLVDPGHPYFDLVGALLAGHRLDLCADDLLRVRHGQFRAVEVAHAVGQVEPHGAFPVQGADEDLQPLDDASGNRSHCVGHLGMLGDDQLGVQRSGDLGQVGRHRRADRNQRAAQSQGVAEI